MRRPEGSPVPSRVSPNPRCRARKVPAQEPQPLAAAGAPRAQSPAQLSVLVSVLTTCLGHPCNECPVFTPQCWSYWSLQTSPYSTVPANRTDPREEILGWPSRIGLLACLSSNMLGLFERGTHGMLRHQGVSRVWLLGTKRWLTNQASGQKDYKDYRVEWATGVCLGSLGLYISSLRYMEPVSSLSSLKRNVLFLELQSSHN